MKRNSVMALILAACILTGCGKTLPETTDETTKEIKISETTEETTVKPTATPTSRATATPIPTATPTPSPTPFETTAFADGIDMFPGYTDEEMYGDDEFLEITTVSCHMDFDWQATRKYGYTPVFVLSEPTSESYPELQSTLDDLSEDMRTRCEEYLSEASDGSAYSQSVIPRRLDQRVVSVVSLIYGNGGARTDVECYNIDPSTGMILSVDDIFTDPAAVADVLETDFIYDLQFVVEPSGVTFVSCDNNGNLAYRTIFYSEYSSLFADADMFDLDSYVMHLSELDSGKAYMIDIDNDGTPDSITMNYDEDDYGYISNLSININGVDNDIDDVGGSGINLKIVCDEGTIYALCTIYQEDANYETRVFRLTSSSAEQMGVVFGSVMGAPVMQPNMDPSQYNPFEITVGHSWASDPDHLYFRCVTNLLTTFMTYYPISMQSFPERAAGYGISDEYQLMSTLCDVNAVDYETGESTVIPEGTQFRIVLADKADSSVVLQDINSGDTYIIRIDDPQEWPRTIDGVSEQDLFAGSNYAG